MVRDRTAAAEEEAWTANEEDVVDCETEVVVLALG